MCHIDIFEIQMIVFCFNSFHVFSIQIMRLSENEFWLYEGSPAC